LRGAEPLSIISNALDGALILEESKKNKKVIIRTYLWEFLRF